MVGNSRSDRAPVAAVIVSWNSARYLPDCLESLRALARPPLETVVVDNGSADGAPQLVERRFSEARLIRCQENTGYCRANNIGISATSAPFVLLLNPDVRLQPSFLEELLPVFRDPEIGLAAGKLLRFDGRTLDSCGQLLGRSRRPVDRGYGREDQGQFDRDDEVFGACGAAALYRRTMLEAVAMGRGAFFDERFFAYYEDLDIAWRAQRQGWRAAYRHRALGYHARGAAAVAAAPLRKRGALLRHGPDLRFHIVKNRYLTILRNDSLKAYLRDLPFIWSADLAILLLLLLTSPAVARRLWQERQLFWATYRQRGVGGSATTGQGRSQVSG